MRIATQHHLFPVRAFIDIEVSLMNLQLMANAISPKTSMLKAHARALRTREGMSCELCDECDPVEFSSASDFGYLSSSHWKFRSTLVTMRAATKRQCHITIRPNSRFPFLRGGRSMMVVSAGSIASMRPIVTDVIMLTYSTWAADPYFGSNSLPTTSLPL